MTRPLASFIAAAALAFAAAQPALANTTTADVSKKASELWQSIRSYSADKHKDAVDHGRKLLKDMDAEIDRLEKKGAAAKGDAKAAYAKEVRDLKASRDKAAAKLDHWGKQSGAAWDEAKNGFADAYRDLHHAYDKASAKLK